MSNVFVKIGKGFISFGKALGRSITRGIEWVFSPTTKVKLEEYAREVARIIDLALPYARAIYLWTPTQVDDLIVELAARLNVQLKVVLEMTDEERRNALFSCAIKLMKDKLGDQLGGVSESTIRDAMSLAYSAMIRLSSEELSALDKQASIIIDGVRNETVA